LAQKKYTVAETGPRIEEFLNNVFKLAGFQLAFSVAEGETPHPDFENPDLIRASASTPTIAAFCALKNCA
jgi:hypothetical protein